MRSLAIRVNLFVLVTFAALAMVAVLWSYDGKSRMMRAQFEAIAANMAPTMIEVALLDAPESVVEMNRQARNFTQILSVRLTSLDGEPRYHYRQTGVQGSCTDDSGWLTPLIYGCMKVFKPLEFESQDWLLYEIELDTSELRQQTFRLVSAIAWLSLLCFWGVFRTTRRWLNEPLAEMVSHLPKVGSGELKLAKAASHRSELTLLAKGLMQADRNLHTEYQQANELTERLKQSLEAKSEFLANASHEIRTPLNGVIGFIDCLAAERSRLSEEGQEQFRLLEGSAQSLLQIVNDVLDFSKLEAGQLQLEPTPCPVTDFIQRIHAHFQGMARLHKVVFAVDISPKLPEFILLDEGRTEQILGNLVSNAIKFSPGASVEIRVDWKAQGRQGELMISVVDSGIGIDSETLPYIFDAYTQADGSVTRRFGGTGLGLSICKKLADLMQARLLVHSTKGKGSEFTLAMPVSVVDDCSVITDKPALELLDKPLAGLSILLAEDNTSNQKLMQVMLKKLGCESLLIARNGQEAVDICHQRHFDLILMDCQMPILDGYRATQQIRLGPQAQILILALTANATSADRQRCLDCGMDAFLTKPITLSALNQGITQALRQHSSLQTG